MRVILIAAFAAGFAATACSGGGMHQQKTETPAQSSAKTAAAPSGGYADTSRESSHRRWGKWRWSGARQDCFFRYRNACYSKFEKACAAAGCKPNACKHDGSAPAVVSCKQ